MLREHEKKVCKRRLSTKQYFNLEGVKKSWKSTSVHVQRLKFLVWKPRLGRASNSYNRKFSSYSPAKVCLFQTFCIISSVLFPFKLLLVSLPTLPPTKKRINIAWPMMWSTLHVSLYRKALCIRTKGDWKMSKKKDRKMSKLFQIRSPFISYCKEEPAQETRTSC